MTYGLLAAVSAGTLALAAGPTTAATAQNTTPAAAVALAVKSADKPAAKSTATKPTATKSKSTVTSSKHRSTSKELRIKYQAQPNYYWCGPAATRNALSATGHNVTMASLAKKMGTTEAGTNSANEITAALNKVTGTNKYRTTEIPTHAVTTKQIDTLKRDIVATIDDNRAVVANVAGTGTDTAGASHSYEGGHYIAVHGYRDDGRQAEIADSADPNAAHYWIKTSDLAHWIATRGYSH
ncbi:MAG: C39 family peptidase [Hamadaea sp.]|nr:C39 family peptidase [Hamadaea sp.]